MNKILRLCVLILMAFDVVSAIGYYERNIARKAYWLLANNLFRVNGTHTDFWAIVDNEEYTKKQILHELGRWAETKGPYMTLQFERTVGFDKQMYKIAEEFGLELVHSSEATALAKKLYEIHENRDLTWKQTCRQKNQLIRLAKKEIQDELKLQLNSWCLPKEKKKKSGLVA